MFQITDAAMTMLDRIRRPEGHVLRIQPADAEHKIQIALAEPAESDLVLDSAGHGSLHVEAAIAAALDEAVLDLVQTGQGPKLTLQKRG